MEKIKFYTQFNRPPAITLKCEDASLTRQEFVKDADINNIMKRYASGIPLPAGTRPPVFDDFSNVPDYQQAFDIVTNASEMFMALPSDVRKRFGNDPRMLLEFLNHEENRDEAVRLGLLNKPAEEKPIEEKPVSVPETKVKGEGE